MERNRGSRVWNDVFQSDERDTEQESLLADDEEDYFWAEDEPCPPNPHSHLPVYHNIHR